MTLGSLLDFLYFWPMPEQHSTVAPQVDALYDAIYWLTLAVFVGCMAVMVYFMWRYRRVPGVPPERSPSHHTMLEVTWSGIPLIIVVFIFWFGWTGFLDMHEPPANSYPIEARAWQWDWEFTYPNGAKHKELHVPPNEPIKLICSSDDVLHAFFVPDFRVKRDIVPGRFTVTWFEATTSNMDPGFQIFCAEYCGTDHSYMRSRVKVHPDRASFEAWLVANSKGPCDKYDQTTEEGRWWAGKELYTASCVSCHNIEGTVGIGPNFSGAWGTERNVVLRDDSVTSVTFNEEYVRESIAQPNAKLVEGVTGRMTANIADSLEPCDITALVQFLRDPKWAPEDKHEITEEAAE
ncbi:cytochrome c oxidase subunit II [Planctomycetota bacterium]|nr:cytochrome c oxidase subunit II [Planctomycetota bacterium]